MHYYCPILWFSVVLSYFTEVSFIIGLLLSFFIVRLIVTKVHRNEPLSELPQPIPRNSVISDHRCISRNYFQIDNAGDSVTLTLYNVMLTSQKP